MRAKPLLIFANKQDLPKAFKAAQARAQPAAAASPAVSPSDAAALRRAACTVRKLADRLGLTALTDRRFQVQESVAKPKPGSTALDRRIAEGFKWLARAPRRSRPHPVHALAATRARVRRHSSGRSRPTSSS